MKLLNTSEKGLEKNFPKKILIGILMLFALALSVSANPVLDAIANQTIDESQTLNFDITGSNPDNGTSVFTDNAAFGTLTKNNDTSATFTWTPGYDDAGVYNVMFTAADDDSSDSKNMTITVNNVNRAPLIDLPASETIIQGFSGTLDLDTYASDPDTGATLTYTPSSKNESEVNCTVSGSILTMTSGDFTGATSCTVKVSDSSLEANDTIDITVEAQNPSIDVGSINFGNENLNTTTDSVSFNIMNNGNMNLNNIVISWDSAYDKYNINFTNGVTSTLNVGATDTATVKMDIPADQSAGSLTVPVQFTSNELTTTFNLEANVQGRLRITDLDIKVDDKTDSNLENKEDDYHIGEKAQPESHVTFNIKVENAFPDSGLEIRDVFVTVTIEGIDTDDDDMEEQSEEFDLDPGDNNKVTLEFDVPLEVKEEDFNVIIEVEGEDEDGNEHRIVKNLILEVDKESHALKIKGALISPEIVECSRNVDLDVTVINIGSQSEDEVVVTVKSSALGIDLTERDIELSEDPEDDDNEFKKTFSFNIKDTVKAGTYSLEVRAFYDEDKLEDLKRVTLQVKDCKPIITQPEEDEEVEVITPPEEEVITPPAEEEEKKGFTETTEYVLLLVLVNLIVVMVAVGLLITFLRK